MVPAGLPVAPQSLERAREVANAIGDFDLVVLQEIWHVRERNLILAGAQAHGFGFYHYFNPSVGFPVPFGPDAFGTGLLVLSRFPISRALYHAFSLTGRPYALHEADFIANKGVGLVRLETPAGPVDLYATHLLANYNARGEPGPGDFYAAHRAAQAFELAQFIAATRRAAAALTLVCGDFNSSPDCLELRVASRLADLRDAFRDRNEGSAGLTFATADNKFSHGDHPMRMDYVLYQVHGLAQGHSPHASGDAWTLEDSSVFKAFFTDARGEKCPLSDHFGVTAAFLFTPAASPSASTSALNEYAVVGADGSTLSPMSAAVSASEPSDSVTPTPTHERVELLREVTRVLTAGRDDTIAHRLTRLRRAGAALLASASVAAAWWWGGDVVPAPYFYLFVGGLLAVLGLVEYMLAFFFLTYECSSFTEMLNEVRLQLHAEAARGQPQDSTA